MEIRKSLVAIGAALMFVGISAPAAAYEWCDGVNIPDPKTITGNLEGLAKDLRCADGTPANPGTWPTDYPIWQKRGGGSCEVQDSLAKKLNEEREEGTKPRPNKKVTNTTAGAANDVTNGKYLSAVEKLDAFVDDVYKSRLNIWDDGPANGFQNTLAAKMYFVGEVQDARVCVCKLTECDN